MSDNRTAGRVIDLMEALRVSLGGVLQDAFDLRGFHFTRVTETVPGLLTPFLTFSWNGIDFKMFHNGHDLFARGSVKATHEVGWYTVTEEVPHGGQKP